MFLRATIPFYFENSLYVFTEQVFSQFIIVSLFFYFIFSFFFQRFIRTGCFYLAIYETQWTSCSCSHQAEVPCHRLRVLFTNQQPIHPPSQPAIVFFLLTSVSLFNVYLLFIVILTRLREQFTQILGLHSLLDLSSPRYFFNMATAGSR